MATTKLSAPILDNKLPAFINNKMIISFKLPKTVSLNDNSVNKIKVIVKHIQSGKEKISKTINKPNDLFLNNGFYTIIFDFSEENPNFIVGQYYKVQIAFVHTEKEEDNIGYYSNAATIKYTAEPKLIIKELEDDNNKIYNTFTGIYSSTDTSEKLYSYYFNIYKDNIIQETSNIQLHNSLTDINANETQNIWNLGKILEDGNYIIEYGITTINNLEISIKKDLIISNYNNEVDDSITRMNLVVNNNYDEGYIDIFLQTNNPIIIEDNTYILTRESNENNEEIVITTFKLEKSTATKKINIGKDHTVKQGIIYTYAIRKKTEEIEISQKLLTQKVLCDFEDAFLSDEDRQLKIRFNPKIASFKTTLLESKMDTIGGKYPFIFRNGNVGYKEFSISGLISLLSDENNLFLNTTNTPLSHISTPAAASIEETEFKHNLSTNNIKNERNFKIEVLNWLTNGKPKLFRSPTEGNFIIRLMNTSLSPNDTLGRMLHTFSATSYEIDDYTYQNLQKYKFTIDKQQIISVEEVEPLYIERILEDYYKNNIHHINSSPSDVLEIIKNNLDIIENLYNGTEIEVIPGAFFYVQITPKEIIKTLIKQNDKYLDEQDNSEQNLEELFKDPQGTSSLLPVICKVIEKETIQLEDGNTVINEIIKYYLTPTVFVNTLDYNYEIIGKKDGQQIYINSKVKPYLSDNDYKYYWPLGEFNEISKFNIGNGIKVNTIFQIKIRFLEKGGEN